MDHERKTADSSGDASAEKAQSAAVLGIGSAQSISSFINRLPAAVWAKDLAGRYVFANAAFHQFFELTAPVSAVGLTDDDFFSAADSVVFRAKDREIITGGHTEQFYDTMPISSGVKQVLMLKFPLVDEHGVALAACSVCVDITDSAQHQAKLEEINQTLALHQQHLLALSRSPAIDTGDLATSLPLVAAAVEAGLKVARVGIWLCDASRQVLICKYTREGGSGQAHSDGPSLNRSDYRQYFAALDTERSIAAHDACHDPRTIELAADYLLPHGICAVLAAPIHMDGDTIGVLCCEHTGIPRHWSEIEQRFATTVADTIARTLVSQRRQQADQALRAINQQLEARVAAETHEARRAETEARNACLQLKQITDDMPGGVCQLLWHAPGQFQFLYMSEGISRMTGLPPEDFTQSLHAVLASVFAEDLPDLIAAIDAAALQPGQPVEHSFRVRHARTGETHWIQVQSRGHARPEGGVLFNGALTDVGNRKQLEDAVAETSRLLKAAMSATTDGIWEWNLTTDNVYYSPSWFALYGYQDQHFPYRLETYTRLCHPDDQANVFAHIANTVEASGDMPDAAEFRMLCADGNWRWVLGRCNVSERKKTGEVLRITGTNTDIDSHKRLEATLELASHQAQSASKAKGDFLANMSHEIRTPMNAVLGFSQLISDTPLNPQQRNYLDKLQAASRTLLTLINDVLDLSKIEAGKLAIEHTAFSLATTFENLATLTSPQANAKGLKLILNAPLAVPDVLMGDPMRVGQVLLNLVGNAVKFTASGSITLNVTRLAATTDSTMLHFAISDTGIGIAPESLNGLFQPFEQADSSISRRYGGTGLGLMICRQLVTLMGGEMGVQSVLGEGSTFWFTARFGMADIKLAPARVTGAASSVGRLAGLRVLVAEDNDINLEILTELLSRVGIAVRAARNGGEAVAACAQGWPQMVLMDMQMPGIDGLTATTMLRAEARFAKLPIIALTANALFEDRQRCLAAGMDDHLPKPVDVDDLYAMLLRWLPAAK